MPEKENNTPIRKYDWVGKWTRMTGKSARMEAKEHSSYIVYEKEGLLVKEFPNGNIVPLAGDGKS